MQLTHAALAFAAAISTARALAAHQPGEYNNAQERHQDSLGVVLSAGEARSRLGFGGHSIDAANNKILPVPDQRTPRAAMGELQSLASLEPKAPGYDRDDESLVVSPSQKSGGIIRVIKSLGSRLTGRGDAISSSASNMAPTQQKFMPIERRDIGIHASLNTPGTHAVSETMPKSELVKGADQAPSTKVNAAFTRTRELAGSLSLGQGRVDSKQQTQQQQQQQKRENAMGTREGRRWIKMPSQNLVAGNMDDDSRTRQGQSVDGSASGAMSAAAHNKQARRSMMQAGSFQEQLDNVNRTGNQKQDTMDARSDAFQRNVNSQTISQVSVAQMKQQSRNMAAVPQVDEAAVLAQQQNRVQNNAQHHQTAPEESEQVEKAEAQQVAHQMQQQRVEAASQEDETQQEQEQRQSEMLE